MTGVRRTRQRGYILRCMTWDGAEAVRSLRARGGISQAQLAERAGMAQSAISAYENGRKVPSLRTLQRLADAIGLELDVSCVPPGERSAPPRSTPTLAQLRRRRVIIERLCAEHGARSPRIFGSVASGTARAGSDVDFLVAMEPGRTYFDVAALHDALEAHLGVPVDVLTEGALHGRLAHVAGEAVAL